jgi:hypothetical protein
MRQVIQMSIKQLEKKMNCGCFYMVLSPFLLIKNTPFGLGGGWDL